MNIRKDDIVKITTGKDKGKTGRVIKVFPSKNRLIVEGLNLVKKHERPTQDNQQGGIIEKESSIDRSNVVLMTNSKTTRVSFKYLDSGKKVRYSKKLKRNID